MADLLRFIIIEDSNDDAELIIRRLEKDGFYVDWIRVETEGDYLKALTKPVDLIISDWSLPKFSGLRALQIIKERNIHVPFIIVSGSFGEDIAINALKLGAHDYLLKDRIDRLGQAVQNTLDHNKLRKERNKAEQALAWEQHLMKVLMDTIPDSIYFKDENSRFIRVNRAQARKLDVNDPSEFVGKTDFDFFSEEHAQTAFDEEQAIIRTGQPLINIEERETYEGKPPEWVSTTKMPLYDASQRIIGTYGISRDITKRKEIEQRLQEIQRFSQATIDALTAHICVLDENGVILAVNQAWKNFAESNPPVIPNHGLGANYLAVCDHARGPEASEAVAFAKGLRAVILDQQPQFMFEYSCHKPGGDKRWFVALVTRFAGEGPIRIVVAHENITERKFAEDALRESEDRYRKLIEESHELIFTHDLEMKILSMNPAMEKVLQIPLENQHGLSLYKIIPVQFHKSFNDYVQTLVHEGINSGRWIILTKNRDERILDFQSTLLERQGQIPVVRCMAQDVTEKVNRERELEAVAAMSNALRSFTLDAQIFPIILLEMTKIIPGDAGAISVLNHERNQLNIESGLGEWKDWAGIKTSVTQGVYAKVFDANLPLTDERATDRASTYWPGPLGSIQRVACIPLIANGESIGAIWLGRINTFSQRDIRILTTLCDIAANAIQNANLFKQVKDRASTLAALYDAGLALNSLLEPDQQLEFLLNIAMDELGAERMVFLRHTPSEPGFSVDLCFGFDTEIHSSLYHSRINSGDDQNKHEWLEIDALPLNFSDIQEERQYALGDPDVRSALWVAIKRGSHVRGVLGVMSTQPNAFNPNQERLLILFANQAAVALENASLLSETKQQLTWLKTLRHIDETINASLDLNVTANELLELIISQLKVDAADILLFNHKTKTLKFFAGHGFSNAALQFTNLRIGQGLAGRTAKDRQKLHITGLQEQTELFAASPMLKKEDFVEYLGVPLISKGNLHGILEIFSKTPLRADEKWNDYLESLSGQAAIAIDNILLFENLQRSNNELIIAYDANIEGWSRALDLRDKETEGHTLRVTEITLTLAQAAGISTEDLQHIRRGALLHDIGKMGIADSILLKPGPLTDEEWASMRKHPEYAYKLLSPIAFLKPALDIPYCHHEKWDGSGYPRGLKGDQIPLSARLFALADVWDALTSDRPYRPAWPPKRTAEYIREQAGGHFDPHAVDIFFRAFLGNKVGDQRPTIVIVDGDESGIHDLMSNLQDQFNILTAHTGEKALSVIEESNAAVILVEQQIPGMTGVDLLKQLSRIKPSTLGFLSSEVADVNALTTAINLPNVRGFIPKPWDIQLLRDKLENAVSEHRALLAKTKVN